MFEFLIDMVVETIVDIFFFSQWGDISDEDFQKKLRLSRNIRLVQRLDEASIL